MSSSENYRRLRLHDRIQRETSFDERSHCGKLNDTDEWTSRGQAGTTHTRISLRIDSGVSNRFASVVFADRQSSGCWSSNVDHRRDPLIRELQGLGVTVGMLLAVRLHFRCFTVVRFEHWYRVLSECLLVTSRWWYRASVQSLFTISKICHKGKWRDRQVEIIESDVYI